MKKIFALGLLSVSATAFSQTCYVDMVNNQNRVVQTYKEYDVTGSCQQAMKECRKAIRFSPQFGGVDCIKQVVAPMPVPTPPNPIPAPYPGPVSSPEFTRFIQPQEKVIYNNSTYTVIGMNSYGEYALRDSLGYTSQGIRRSDLAITSGCGYVACVTDKVVQISGNTSKTVAAIRFNGSYVLRDSLGYLNTADENDVATTQGCDGAICVGEKVVQVSTNTSKTAFALGSNGRIVLKDSLGYLNTTQSADVAVTKGCAATFGQSLCVGRQFLNRSNQRFTVFAIQANGKIVGKDSLGYLTSNINPNDVYPL